MSRNPFKEALEAKGELGEIKCNHEDLVLMLECAGLDETFDDSEIAEIAEYLTAYRGQHKRSIFRQGDPSTHAWIIAYGVIELSTLDLNGRRVLSSELDVGDVCGDMEFIDGELRSSTATVVSDNAILMLLSKASFDSLSEPHPVIAHKLVVKLAKDISRRLRATAGNLTGLYCAK